MREWDIATDREAYTAQGSLVIPAQEEQIGYYFSPEQLPEHLKDVAPSVGKLINTEDQANGSCFLIELGGKKYLVGAYHTFTTENRVVAAAFPSGETISLDCNDVTIHNELLTDDIVLLRRDDAKTPGLTLGDPTDIQKSTTTLVLGYPRSIDTVTPSTKPLVSVGTILETDIQPGGYISAQARDLIRVSARAQSGNSGGPLINDRGDVLGVVIHGFPPKLAIDSDVEFFRDAMRMFQDLAPRSRHESLAVPIHKILPFIT